MAEHHADHRREDWRTILDDEDRNALAGYARTRSAYDGADPALIVIDVTEAFVGPDLPVAEAQRTSRQACGERAWRAMPVIARMIGAFREAGRPIVYTIPDPVQRWAGAATRGEAGAPRRPETTIVDAVRPVEGDEIIPKTKASAFFGTPLLSGLVKNGIDTVVLVGCTTSGCVRSTAIDGTSYGFEVFVVEDGVFDRSRLSHLVTLADLDVKYGRVHPAEDVVRSTLRSPA